MRRIGELVPRPAVAWFAVALVVRAFVCWRTPVPSHDVHYLWMGERLAADGDLGAAFTTPHHPLYGILVGAMLRLWPALGGVGAGQLVAAVTGSLAVIPLFAVARRWHGDRVAHTAAALFACGLWLARHPAACAAEGPLYLFLATGLWALAVGRPALAGIATGLAYATKPEGAGLAIVALPWLWCAGGRVRDGWLMRGSAPLQFALGALAAAWWVPLGFAVFGPGWTLTPKLAFVLAEGVAGADPGTGGVAHYLEHLVRTFGVCFEGIGYLVFPLALAGAAWRPGLSGLRDPRSVPWLAFALLILVVPILRTHHRFVSGYGALLLPAAGAGMVAALGAIGRTDRRARILALLLVLAPDLVRLPRSVNAERVYLIDLGAAIRTRLALGGALATEEARLEYYSGQKPGPPRRIERDELLARIDDPDADVRVVAVIPRRTGLTAADLTARGFEPMSLPGELPARLAERGLLVFARPSRTR